MNNWTENEILSLSSSVDQFAMRLIAIEIGAHYELDYWSVVDGELIAWGYFWVPRSGRDETSASCPISWLVIHLNGGDWEQLARERKSDKEAKAVLEAEQRKLEQQIEQERRERDTLRKLQLKYGREGA